MRAIWSRAGPVFPSCRDGGYYSVSISAGLDARYGVVVAGAFPAACPRGGLAWALERCDERLSYFWRSDKA
jgi:hypothetical protein